MLFLLFIEVWCFEIDCGDMIKFLWCLYDGVLVELVFMCYLGCIMLCVLS